MKDVELDGLGKLVDWHKVAEEAAAALTRKLDYKELGETVAKGFLDELRQNLRVEGEMIAAEILRKLVE